MYLHKTVLNKTNRGKKIIKTLFSKIKKNTKKFIKKESLDNESKERNICDFIAGMTDRYAINLYNSIK
jgi:dGTPase